MWEKGHALRRFGWVEGASLPEGSAIAEMTSDYAMTREQTRVCRKAAVPSVGSDGQRLPS